MTGKTHTSTVQEQRFWVQPGKFSGMNGNFSAFLWELLKELHYIRNKTNEKSRHFQVVERAEKYIQIIYNNDLTTIEKMKSNKELLKFRLILQEVPLKSYKKRNPVPVQRDEFGNPFQQGELGYHICHADENGIPIIDEWVVDSDMEISAPQGDAGAAYPKGWCKSTAEREVSEFLKNTIEGALQGPALEVVNAMGMPRDRTGFQILERLCEVYGRKAAHITQIPITFQWGHNPLVDDWTTYKHLLDSVEYSRIHPTNVSLMVDCAMRGFEVYDNYHRIHDHVRVTAGLDPDWETFKEAVDKFCGDPHRQQFDRAIYTNENGLQSMAISGIAEQSEVEYVNAIKAQFPAKRKFKGKGKGQYNKKPTYQKPPQYSENEMYYQFSKSDKCAWCGEKSHKHWQCKTLGNGKWDDKICNKCGGKKHPPELCATPTKQYRKIKKK